MNFSVHWHYRLDFQSLTVCWSCDRVLDLKIQPLLAVLIGYYSFVFHCSDGFTFVYSSYGMVSTRVHSRLDFMKCWFMVPFPIFVIPCPSVPSVILGVTSHGHMRTLRIVVRTFEILLVSFLLSRHVLLPLFRLNLFFGSCGCCCSCPVLVHSYHQHSFQYSHYPFNCLPARTTT